MKRKQTIYSKSELDMFKNIEKGNYHSLEKKEFNQEKKRFEKIAINTLKRKSINIRVFENDIERIKIIASSEGIPYQTLITSILHKVAIGKAINYTN